MTRSSKLTFLQSQTQVYLSSLVAHNFKTSFDKAYKYHGIVAPHLRENVFATSSQQRLLYFVGILKGNGRNKMVIQRRRQKLLLAHCRMEVAFSLPHSATELAAVQGTVAFTTTLFGQSQCLSSTNTSLRTASSYHDPTFCVQHPLMKFRILNSKPYQLIRFIKTHSSLSYYDRCIIIAYATRL